MCDLITGLMIASTGLGVMGDIQEGKANAANAEYQQQVALMNAGFTGEKITDAAVRGAESEQQVRREGAQVIGSQRATMGATGIDMTFGSPLDMILGTAQEIEMDAFRSRQNTGREIQDLEQTRANQLADAGALGSAAKNYRTAGVFNALGTAASGAAGVSKYRASIGA